MRTCWLAALLTVTAASAQANDSIAELGAGGLILSRSDVVAMESEDLFLSRDKVTVDFSDRCACGRHGPTLLDTISRYAQPGQDDHIGCAGTIDAYIRGAVNA